MSFISFQIKLFINFLNDTPIIFLILFDNLYCKIYLFILEHNRKTLNISNTFFYLFLKSFHFLTIDIYQLWPRKHTCSTFFILKYLLIILHYFLSLCNSHNLWQFSEIFGTQGSKRRFWWDESLEATIDARYNPHS